VSSELNRLFLLLHVSHLFRSVKSQVSFILKNLASCLRPTETSVRVSNGVALRAVGSKVVQGRRGAVDGVRVDFGRSEEESSLESILLPIASNLMASHQLLELCQLRLMKVSLLILLLSNALRLEQPK
jgi:hypothetical protein